jgi:homoserine O-acetyltransferase
VNTSEYLYHHINNFKLESGNILPDFRLKYSTLGKLNTDKSNVVWVCHALTGNSNFTEWWRALFAAGGPFDPKDCFIICANTLGGCYGSTGPLSINPLTNFPFYHDFPIITNRDIVRSFDLLRDYLGINKINTLIGGSLGGQQALTWAIHQPARIENLIVIACNAKHSSWGIAINEAQRMAIEADNTWKTNERDAGIAGLKAARAMSMVTFRSFHVFQSRETEDYQTIDNYQAASYQRYQGDKLANRFNAYSYWTLTKTMDSHHVGRGFPNIKDALKKVFAKTLVVGIDSDLLFPVSEQQFIYQNIPNAQLEIIQSPYGHDAFLIEAEKLAGIIQKFLKLKFVLS